MLPDHPHIKSFVRREGRLTPGQRKALEKNAANFILPVEESFLDLQKYFPTAGPIALEIGFGMGHALLSMAKNFPQRNFIGVEVYRPGIGTVLAAIEKENLSNIRIFAADAFVVLNQCIRDHTLDAIYIFFPDPWPKTRHHKRRLIQPAFVNLLCEKLKPSGLLHLATDWEDYAQQMLTVLSQTPTLQNLHPAEGFAPTRADRPASKYELRGQRLGHGVWDLRFGKNP